MIQRQVQQIHPKLVDESFGESIPFTAYLGQPNIVLLGDPGAGKTHLFETTARQTNARFMTVRQFLNVPPSWANDTIFIDALDERRAGRGDDSVIDALVQKLFQSPPAKLRISCRDRDWLGESDLEAFEPYFEAHGEAVVLALRALRPEEQIEVLQANGIHDAESFLREANEREMEEFLHNPQNLLMLADVVGNLGCWPSTRLDLFRKSTELLLSERNATHRRKDAYSHDDLRPTAGALCALRLISDVAGLGVDEHTSDPAYPGFGSIPFLDKAKVKATLRRSAFVSVGDSPTVDYVHRTTAEFLAAEWLTSQLNNGLPVRRVTALLGIDDHPASELRGLHSWLPVFAPKLGDIFIDADPYGVLVYGDVASLSPSSRIHLLNALDRLSTIDPWFRSDGRSRERLGGLCSPEMTSAFRAVLTNPQPSHSMRQLVLEAMVSNRTPQDLLPEVASVFADQGAWLAERRVALELLSTAGGTGETLVASAYSNQMSWTPDEFHLRAHAISALYGKVFGPSNVIDLLTRLQNADADVSNSVDIWTMSQGINPQDAGLIIDGVAPPTKDLGISRSSVHNTSTVLSILTKLLIQTLDVSASLSGVDLWRWICKLASYNRPSTLAKQLREALQARKATLLEALDQGIKTLSAQNDAGHLRYKIQTIFHQIVTADEMLERFVVQFAVLPHGDARTVSIYECALSMICAYPDKNGGLFDALCEQGERADLRDARDRALVCPYPDWRAEQAATGQREQKKQQENRVKRVQNFRKSEAAVRDGTNLSWLAYIAQVYLGAFPDVDSSLSPHQRLVVALNEECLTTALAGLVAVLGRSDLPNVISVGEKNVSGMRVDWWLSVIAALDERWSKLPTLDGLTEEILSSALAINLACPTTQREGNTIRALPHSWVTAAMNERPDIVRDVYVAVAIAGLQAHHAHVDGLYELRSAPELANYRSTVGIDLLRRFPDAQAQQLQLLLECACATPKDHANFLDLVRRTIASGHTLSQESYVRWLVAAFLIAPSEFEAQYFQCAKTDTSAIWLVRDFSFPADGPSGDTEQRISFDVAQRERIVLLVGERFPDTPHPAGGWSGNQNPWDASEFLRKMVNRISAESTAAATASLERLLSDERVASYRDFILHAAASQRVRRRGEEFRKAGWPQAITTLSNGAPTNAADLHALLFDTLVDVSRRISHANNDIYKQFWNENANGKVTAPKSEESCRHVLIGLLRDRLESLRVSIEPEGHMADGKRADIIASLGLVKIPVELKRNYHSAVWTAAHSQLDSMYTLDPAASGYGIYAIFWFGDAASRKMPLHPTLKTRPTSASAMAQMLRELVPIERRSHISIVVIDVESLNNAKVDASAP
jgi:hypothetical protein